MDLYSNLKWGNYPLRVVIAARKTIFMTTFLSRKNAEKKAHSKHKCCICKIPRLLLSSHCSKYAECMLNPRPATPCRPLPGMKLQWVYPSCWSCKMYKQMNWNRENFTLYSTLARTKQKFWKDDLDKNFSWDKFLKKKRKITQCSANPLAQPLVTGMCEMRVLILNQAATPYTQTQTRLATMEPPP